MRFGQIENNKDEIALKSPLSVKETFQFNKPSMSIWSRSVNLKTSQHSLPCFLTRSAKRTFGPGLSIYFFCSLLDVIFQLLFLLLAVCALSNTSYYDSFYHSEILFSSTIFYYYHFSTPSIHSAFTCVLSIKSHYTFIFCSSKWPLLQNEMQAPVVPFYF